MLHNKSQVFLNTSSTAACMKREDKILSFPTLSFVWARVGASASSSFPSSFVLLSERARDGGKIVIFKITSGRGRPTGLQETKTIFITIANQQQGKIHTFYITTNMTLKNKLSICNNYYFFITLVRSGRKTRGLQHLLNYVNKLLYISR